MENFSQKDINEISKVLRKNKQFKLAKRLEKADIISSLYVFTYLKIIDRLREESRVKDEDSKYPEAMRNDFDGFKKLLGHNYHLELDSLIRTKEEFEGMAWLLYKALERQHLICDFNDSVHPSTKIGACEDPYHDENFNTNQKNQSLKLTYEYSEDNQKMDKRHPIYTCRRCQKLGDEYGEGYLACDVELSE